MLAYFVSGYFRYYAIAVATGSMTPNINVYDVVVAVKADTSKLKVGDVISFYTNEVNVNGLTITHRIYQIVEQDGGRYFKTKGDYVVIDDYSTDVDSIRDVKLIEKFLKIKKGEVKMIKVEVIEDFHLAKFNELKNLVRRDISKNEPGMLYDGDCFECTEEMSKYLTGENQLKKAFVKVIEVIPEKIKPVEVKHEEVKVEETIPEEKPKKSKKKIRRK